MSHHSNSTSYAGPHVKPLWAAIFTFIVIAAACAYFTYQRYMILRNEERQNAENIAESARNRLQHALQHSFSATQAMTLLIDKSGTVNNFDSIAPLIFKAHKYINALQLVPGGVIRYVYPMEGNEAVINYNILDDPARNKEAYKAFEKKELFFGGPFKLKQGGIGIVGRLPVFINEKPWGFSAVVIKLSTLLSAAGIDTTGGSGYYFQLSKINPDTNTEEYFLPFRGYSPGHFEVAVSIPNGEWTLSLMPVKGFKTFRDVILSASLGLLLSLLGAFFTYYYSKTPARLQKLVAERTAELDKSEKRNRAIVTALPDMVFIVNNEGRIIDFNNSGGHQTWVGPDQFLLKTIPEVMARPLAENLMLYVEKVLQTGEVFSYGYQMNMNGEVRSYESRFAPYRTDDVMVLVRDTTEAKKVEAELLKSREELRRLSNHLEDVREEERLHIAREIHDELGQHLTVLKMNFSFLEKNILAVNPGFAPELNKIMSLISDMVTAVRKISHELRPAILDQLGLVAAMEWYGNDFEKNTGIKTSFISDFPDKDIPDKLRIGLFRIFQESLTNVARHAAASRVDVSLHLQDGDLVMLVEDNGKGFNTDTIDHRKTLGILGMKERAMMMGGTYNIHSTPGKGTMIDVVVPFNNN